MNVTVARYVLGIASLAVIFVSMALVAVALRRRFFAAWSGAPARLAEALIGLSVLVATLELLGTLGLFRLVPIVVASAVIAAAAAVILPPAARPRRSAPQRPAFVEVTVATLASATVVAVWASPTLQAYDLGIHTFDSLWYHMPWAASFAQTGHITPLHFDLEFLLAFYPATGELFHGLGILALGRDTLSPGLNLLWLGLALLAGWCIGRPRGREPAAALGVALILVTPMMDFSQPGSADGDVAGIFFVLAAAALVVNAQESRAAYVLGGVAAGLAMSIKLTFLAPALALTLGVLVIGPRNRRLPWLGAFVLAGGFWYVRNLIAVGNPLPWTSFAGILPTPAPPLQQHVTYAVAHYLTNARFWDHFFVPGISAQLGSWWFVIAGAGVLGPLLCLLPGANRSLRMLAVVALAALAAYLLTPNSAMGPEGDPVGFSFNMRYSGPGLALAFAILPLAPALQTPRRQIALITAVAVTLIATVSHASLWPTRHAAAAAAVGAAVLTIGLLFAALRNARRALSLGLLATLLLAGAAVAYPWQRHYLRGRYAYRGGISHLSPVWAFFRTIGHARVGVAGTYGEFFSYPLLGIDDSNRVQYVAQRGPHGSFTPIGSCRQWRAAVNAANLRYLVTTPERDFWRPSRLRPAPEGGWTATDPTARVVLRTRASGQPIEVFALRGPLHPHGCKP